MSGVISLTSFEGAGCTNGVCSRTAAVEAVNFTLPTLKVAGSSKTLAGISVNVDVRILFLMVDH